jgi:hypothetical protein
MLAVLTDPLNDALSKPDPLGRAELVGPLGASQQRVLVAQQNTFTPQWATAGWAHVPLDGSTRIRVQLWDEDPANNDPMGTFEVNADDLLAALRAERVHHVRVDEQTHGQVLFAAISVFAE